MIIIQDEKCIPMYWYFLVSSNLSIKGTFNFTAGGNEISTIKGIKNATYHNYNNG